MKNQFKELSRFVEEMMIRASETVGIFSPGEQHLLAHVEGDGVPLGELESPAYFCFDHCLTSIEGKVYFTEQGKFVGQILIVDRFLEREWLFMYSAEAKKLQPIEGLWDDDQEN